MVRAVTQVLNFHATQSHGVASAVGHQLCAQAEPGLAKQVKGGAYLAAASMPRRLCAHCGERGAALKRPKTHESVRLAVLSQQPPRHFRVRAALQLSITTCLQICKECFYVALEDEVHQTIQRYNLFTPGEVVALGASGGKDSTVLAHMMKTLNERHKCASPCGRALGRNPFDHANCMSLASSDAQCDVPTADVDQAHATPRCLHVVMRRSQNGALYAATG